jgi:hypothetical protein
MKVWSAGALACVWHRHLPVTARWNLSNSSKPLPKSDLDFGFAHCEIAAKHVRDSTDTRRVSIPRCDFLPTAQAQTTAGRIHVEGSDQLN